MRYVGVDWNLQMTGLNCIKKPTKHGKHMMHWKINDFKLNVAATGIIHFLQ
jgi:hypothetical protein